MRTTNSLSALLMLTAVVLLAGCTPAPPTPSLTPMATSVPSPTADPAMIPITPETMEERMAQLREDLTATSADCASWMDREFVPPGSIGSTCDEIWTAFVFDTNEARNTVLTLNQGSPEAARFIVGPGWLIRSDDLTPPEQLDRLAAELDYRVWQATDPIPGS